VGNAQNGIQIDNAPNNVIHQNLISGNGLDGVSVQVDPGVLAGNNRITGNRIGTAIDGLAPIPNGGNGVRTVGPTQTIIGSSSGINRNTIAFNLKNGIALNGDDHSSIQNNFIGVDASGAGRAPNHDWGVLVSNSFQNGIGASANVIAANGAGGIAVQDGSHDNTIAGNAIGLDAFGNAAGNNGPGLLIAASSNNAVATNNVANNAIGVRVSSSSAGNRILTNNIFTNTGLGIDLDPVGVTPNDAGDGDTGPNNLQNFPAITQATAASG